MGSSAMQGKLWGAAAKQWAHLQEPQHRPLWDVMLAAANVSEKTVLLDAGCGAGGTCQSAEKLGATITGLDASESLLSIAQKRMPAATFDVGELEELPYPDHSFDVIVASLSVQYAENPDAALKELLRVCKPTGCLVISTWGDPEQCDQKQLLEAMGKVLPAPPPGKGPFSLSAEGQLEQLVEQSGWQATDRKTVNCPFAYRSLEEHWLAQSSAGPMQGALGKIDESELREVLEEAIRPFTNDRNEVTLMNQFVCVKAVPSVM